MLYTIGSMLYSLTCMKEPLGVLYRGVNDFNMVSGVYYILVTDALNLTAGEDREFRPL